MIVWVLTAWNERTGDDEVRVYTSSAKARAAIAELEGPDIFIGLYRRTVRP